MFQIHRIPIYQDNYVWILSADSTAWVIDPGDHAPVLRFLEQQKLTPAGILLTHRHWDHVTGVQPFLDRYGPLPVYGPQSPTIEALVTETVGEGDLIRVGPLQAEVWSTPGHTLDHISYYFKSEGKLFCGDTLFACGCGRLFDGSMEQLYHSLRRIAQLPLETQIYCTHEYTLANIDFALTVDPCNSALRARQIHCQHLRQRDQPTLPTTVRDELATNPFLRTDTPSVQQAICAEIGAKETSDFSCFTALRNWKNRY